MSSVGAVVASGESIASATVRFPDRRMSHVLMHGGPEVSTRTVGELLRAAAAQVPDRIALKEPTAVDGTPGRTWSYSALLAQAEQGARALLQEFSPGEHVTVWVGNCPEWVVVQLAAALAGIVLVAANPAHRDAEIEYAIAQSASVGLIYNRHYRDVHAEQIVQALLPVLPRVRFTLAIDDWGPFVAGAPAATCLPDIECSAPAMIQYTSGTTGKPKAAILSHRSIVNCGRFSALHLELKRSPTWYMASPLFHTGGCVFGVLGTLWQKGTLVIPPQFDAARMLDAIALDGVNGATMVPTMCLRLLQAYADAPTDISNLEVIVGGGASVSPELVHRLEAELGCEFMMVYGQTETGSAVSMSTRGDDVFHRTETVGRLYPNLEARIADVVTGKTVPLGEQGEILLRGYMAFSGYFDMPEASAQTIDSDGWLRTGDLGTLTADGYLTVTGRLKNTIIRGGEKIFPREIEDVLAAHPAIMNAAVFGIPDRQWGEVVAVAVILRPDSTMDAETLKAWLRERIARYKVPQHVTFVSQFPMTPSGKVQTFILKDMLVQELAQSGSR